MGRNWTIYDIRTKFPCYNISMKLVNLTPHKLNIYDKEGKKQIIEIAPSGEIIIS